MSKADNEGNISKSNDTHMAQSKYLGAQCYYILLATPAYGVLCLNLIYDTPGLAPRMNVSF